jgi:TetR/AcrR family transcriptional regulator, regulator of biofilm formation and stress response
MCTVVHIMKRGPNDPERRDRIAAAALEVAAQRGVRSVSHRAVAEAAGVPLGSTTYHFTSLDDLLAAATILAVDDYRRELDRWSATVDDGVEVADAIAALAAELLGPSRDRMKVGYDLHFEALHRPVLKDAAHAWSVATCSVFERHVAPPAARALTVILDGVLVDNLLYGVVLADAELAELLRAVLAGPLAMPVEAAAAGEA